MEREISGGSATALGFKSYSASNAVAIGTYAMAEENAVAIGSNVSAAKNTVVISNINITELLNRVEKLEETIVKQQETIDALWYHPGMPGYEEAKEKFSKNYTFSKYNYHTNTL